MSVQTTADVINATLKVELIEIRKLLAHCNSLIDEMFDPETWGSKEFSESFVEGTDELREELQKTKRLIDIYRHDWN